MKNVFRELGAFANGNLQEYSFRPPKKYKLPKQSFWSTRNLQRRLWNRGDLDSSEFPNTLLRDEKAELVAKIEKSEILSDLFDEIAKNLDHHGSPKLNIL